MKWRAIFDSLTGRKNMKTNKQWAAALCMIALAGCASDRMSSDTSSSNSGYSSSASQAAPATSSAPQSGTAAQTSYGVVQAIDQMQRQDVGVGVVGAAAVGGTGMPTDKVYRVTVRMDDGNNQMVVVDSMPSYKIGDRVRYSNGTVVAY
jgi:outer membrane lipoprotein SlyB